MKGRVPFIGRRATRGGEARIWGAIVDRVLRRPVVGRGASGGLLVALAIPALGMHTADPGLQGLPHDLPIVQTLDRIQAAFPGGPLAGARGRPGRDVTRPQVQAGDPADSSAGAGHAARCTSRSPCEISRGHDGRGGVDPARRQGHRLDLGPRAGHAARRA